MSNMMGKQMKYFLPIFVAFVSYQISAAIALYWSVNNIFTTIQEMRIHKKIMQESIVPKAEVVESQKLN
jgi:membrane protein insertase Oxa1/YidC/SpoIIIJ